MSNRKLRSANQAMIGLALDVGSSEDQNSLTEKAIEEDHAEELRDTLNAMIASVNSMKLNNSEYLICRSYDLI